MVSACVSEEMKHLPKLPSLQRYVNTGFAMGIRGIFYSDGDRVASLGKRALQPY